jgi:hypothetical protein
MRASPAIWGPFVFVLQLHRFDYKNAPASRNLVARAKKH